MNIYQEISVAQSKTCIKCKIEKSITEFYIRKDAKDNLHNSCKECTIKRVSNNINDSYKQYQKEYGKIYRKENRGYVNAHTAKREASRKRAVVSWSELDEIRELYKMSANMSKSTGIPHNVDHIIPLQSDIVCGLHVLANLQILSESENKSKGNRHWPDMPTVLIV